ncbi:MAG TPA: galactose-1-phosphate uridylyltransferase [Dermatophilaceae bacterium]|nr:galactose-1-phosphate uridylyltransferase [Dermatophilaceae bacterium]
MSVTPPATVRTSRRLADGREVIYFDDGAKGPRNGIDRRPLGERADAGELRLDALTGDWVAIAGHRQARTFLPSRDDCPLCPTRGRALASEIPESAYDVVVFENRFPSFSDQGAVGAAGEGLLLGGRAHGRCEVVCFTSDHDASFAALSPSRVRTVIEAWVDRTAELSRLPGIEHVLCFENRGPEIGVTLHHPHGQIYAYPFIPARVVTLLDAARRHHAETGRLLGADILAAERQDGERMVIEGEHWSAYVPYAARWPLEVHLVPHRDVADLPSLTAQERDELADVHQRLFRGLDRYYTAADGEPVRLPYIAAWHQAPVRRGREVSRLHLQVMSVLRSPGRLKYVAGSESAAGAWVNDVQPERIAERLRQVVG